MSGLAMFTAADAALEILNETEGLENVELAGIGDPEPSRSTESVWIYKTAAPERNFRTLGGVPALLDEMLEIQGRVVVMTNDNAKARCEELALIVDNALRFQATLDETVVFSHIATASASQLSLDGRRGFEMLFTLTGKARI